MNLHVTKNTKKMMKNQSEFMKTDKSDNLIIMVEVCVDRNVTDGCICVLHECPYQQMLFCQFVSPSVFALLFTVSIPVHSS